MELGHNDIISFGFNCLKLYNIKDKQAFIYRVVREADLDTINIYDSDENDDANDDDVVVVLDSDSADGGYPEIASDASEATEDDNVRDIDDDVIISSDDDDYYDSDDSIGSGDFVVTQRVENRAQRPTIDLNADDDIELTSLEQSNKHDVIDDQVDKEVDKEQKSDDAAPTTSTGAIQLETLEKDVAPILNGAEDEAVPEKSDAKATQDEISAPETSANTSASDRDTIVEVAEHTNESATRTFRSDANVRRGIQVISAQPLRKRRRTITEREYEDSKKQRDQKRSARAERLAQIAADEKEKSAIAAAAAAPNLNEAESKSPVAVPKVKISQVTRAEMLATDMLADSLK